MRILVVIPHYSGLGNSGSGETILASQSEPISRIAALNETITCLHRNFGIVRNTFEGHKIQNDNVLDIIIVTKKDHNLLGQMGMDQNSYTTEFIDGQPMLMPFHAQRIFKEKAGKYDFYCLVEDDIAIHDPQFFAKLSWFQNNFGSRTLLAPTRVETSFGGTLSKTVIDPVLNRGLYAPFRRNGQLERLSARWNETEIEFELPTNPHAASFFLTSEQLDHWMTQPSFGVHDTSWVGPLESGVTLSVGKVFDIYKAAVPDPFFLEVHHYDVRFASRHAPAGQTCEPPRLLAIAQMACRELAKKGDAVNGFLNAPAIAAESARFADQQARIKKMEENENANANSIHWLQKKLTRKVLQRLKLRK